MGPIVAFAYILEDIGKLECGGAEWLILSVTQTRPHGPQT